MTMPPPPISTISIQLYLPSTTLQTHPCNENRVFPARLFSQGKTSFHYKDPCNENKENMVFPAKFFSGMGLQFIDILRNGKLLKSRAAYTRKQLFLKLVAFIAGESVNQAAKTFSICFSIGNLIANISLYALSWPKLNFGCYLTSEIIF